MKKLLAALLIVAFAGSAHAQNSKAVMNAEIDTNLPDNTAGAITPAIVRTTLKDMVASYIDWVTCTTGGSMVYWNGTSPACFAGTATAGQILRSGSTATPSWSTASFPATAAAGTVLGAATANVIAATATPTLGIPGSVVGSVSYANATSGTITVQPQTGALGSAVLTYPAVTDTVTVLAAAQALTNKTYNGNTFTAGTGTLTIAAGKTLTASNSLTLAGTDSTTMTFPSVSATITRTVASGTKALSTTAISSATCSSAQTSTATGTATTDVVNPSFNGDPTAVAGYVPLSSGMLTIIAYPTADTVNFKVCNNTASTITPGALTLNWQVVR